MTAKAGDFVWFRDTRSDPPKRRPGIVLHVFESGRLLVAGGTTTVPRNNVEHHVLRANEPVAPRYSIDGDTYFRADGLTDIHPNTIDEKAKWTCAPMLHAKVLAICEANLDRLRK